MATAVLWFSRNLVSRNTGVVSRNIVLKPSNTTRLNQCRNAVSTANGGVQPKPDKISFGLIRMTAVVIPFLYVGTLISKNFAALLEEHDIFVPEDDDDDD
ncbi:essential MCU regulator, mitochondrial [Oncorhynchus keta]|uniref:essential MCU regulator, mitochondrial n=1 Tax=Oncorhynchus keta TaxID=8018 RepID=UPI0015F8A26D|nr:essential MCU regulator, mitochondrial [Oncorhynchus keta]XP_035602397.1 essential MCU regulator, mitochondrial [Oncorhynchus keta]